MNHDDDKVNSDDKHTLHQTLITVRIMMMIRMLMMMMMMMMMMRRRRMMMMMVMMMTMMMRMTVIYLVAGLATLRMLHTCC